MQTSKPRFLLALCLAASLYAMPETQAATTGTVTINGQVPATCAVVVTATAGASNIADISAGDTDRQVATVNENCNDPLGYTMTVLGTHSTNHTGLFVDSVSGDSQPFTIKYDGVSVPVGPGSILASYAYTKTSGAADVKRNTWAVGYDYSLSKRTDVYAAYMRDKVTNLSSADTFGVGIRAKF